MEFKCLTDWIQFVLDYPMENLLTIFEENFALQDHLCDDSETEIDGLILNKIKGKSYGKVLRSSSG